MIDDGLPEKVGKIDAFRGDALEQDPLVTQAKASIKQKLSSESGKPSRFGKFSSQSYRRS